MAASFTVKKAFPGLSGPAKNVARISARAMADGRILVTTSLARSTRVQVIRKGHKGRPTMTLLQAHDKHRHAPAGISYKAV